MNHAGTTVLGKEADDLVLALQRVEAERTRFTILSMLVGAILGWAIGMGQLIVIGSWDLLAWGFMPLIPFYSAFGWALFGMIVGGSGLVSKPKISSDKLGEAYPKSDAA